jgi:BarA-like signal transduction histidine kinase
MTRQETVCEISRLDWMLKSVHLTFTEKKTALRKRAALIESLAQFHPVGHPLHKLIKEEKAAQ